MFEFNGTKDSESMSETVPVSDDGVMGFHNDRVGDRNSLGHASESEVLSSSNILEISSIIRQQTE